MHFELVQVVMNESGSIEHVSTDTVLKQHLTAASLRSLREGIDTATAAGRMVAGVLASLAELELELGRERRSAAREARRARGQAIGRPKALDDAKAALAQRMHASGESAPTIAATLGVSRATVYRVLADTAS